MRSICIPEMIYWIKLIFYTKLILKRNVKSGVSSADSIYWENTITYINWFQNLVSKCNEIFCCYGNTKYYLTYSKYII